MTDNNIVVLQDDFEKLMQKIADENAKYERAKHLKEEAEELAQRKLAEGLALADKLRAEREALAKKIKDGRRNLGKSIMSVYYFLRTQLGMMCRDLTKQEFEIAEAKLRSIAEEKVKISALFKFWTIRTKRGWQYYLTNRYFKSSVAPFGITNAFSVWIFYHPVFEEFTEGGLWERSPYDPDCCDDLAHKYPLSVPPNFQNLLNELWEERRRFYAAE